MYQNTDISFLKSNVDKACQTFTKLNQGNFKKLLGFFSNACVHSKKVYYTPICGVKHCAYYLVETIQKQAGQKFCSCGRMLSHKNLVELEETLRTSDGMGYNVTNIQTAFELDIMLILQLVVIF